MRVLNPNRFYVEKGDKLLYNSKAVDWMSNDRKRGGHSPWPSCDELNSKNPCVLKYCVQQGIYGKYIELCVEHSDNIYTGLSGAINSRLAVDVWFLHLDGTFLDECPYPIFIRVKNEK